MIGHEVVGIGLQDRFCQLVVAIALRRRGKPDRRVDKDAQRRPVLSFKLVFFRPRAECSSKIAFAIILSLLRAILVTGPASAISKIAEMPRLPLASPKSCTRRRRTYSANEILSSAALAWARRCISGSSVTCVLAFMAVAPLVEDPVPS